MKMEKMILVAAAAGGLACVVAMAAGGGTGTIAEVHMGPHYGSKVFVRLAGSVSGQPACQTNSTCNIAFDPNTTIGKSALATILLAKAMNAGVTYGGADQCTLLFNIEDLSWITLN